MKVLWPACSHHKRLAVYDAVSVRSEAPEADNFLNQAGNSANVVPSDTGADMLELSHFPADEARSK